MFFFLYLQIYQCKDCHKVIRWRDCSKELHKCGTRKCPSCEKYVDMTTHRCFLGKVKPIEPNEKLIFFDFETEQSTGEHKVNYAVAQYTDGTTFKFENDNSSDACFKFCSFLVSDRHRNHTAIAHNMKGFDGQFILGWLLQQGVTPDIIPNGSKIMSLRIRSLNLRIIDSLNFLPMALSKLPRTFGIHELKKGYFPHKFNRPENQCYVGELPAAEFYSPDTMSEAERNDFFKWYHERKSTPFNFKEEIEAYCR